MFISDKLTMLYHNLYLITKIACSPKYERILLKIKYWKKHIENI